MLRFLRRHTVALFGIVACLSAGCAASPPTRFYILAAVPATDTGNAAASELSIGVGPVSLPEYLDRPQIVTRASPSKLELAEFDRWAASLQEDFTRVLSENLSILIPTDRIVTSSRPRSMLSRDYQVAVEVTRFDSNPAGDIVLVARWKILAPRGEELLLRKSRLKASPGTQDYEAIVTAMSKTIEALSREIATAIRTLAHKPVSG